MAPPSIMRIFRLIAIGTINYYKSKEKYKYVEKRKTKKKNFVDTFEQCYVIVVPPQDRFTMKSDFMLYELKFIK